MMRKNNPKNKQCEVIIFIIFIRESQLPFTDSGTSVSPDGTLIYKLFHIIPLYLLMLFHHKNTKTQGGAK